MGDCLVLYSELGYLLDITILKFRMNVITPGFAIFHVFGRMGCFFGGCCYGKIATWGIALYDEPGVLRIPIQLIESGCILLIFIVLLYMS